MSFIKEVKRISRSPVSVRDSDQFSSLHEGKQFKGLFGLYRELKSLQKGPCSITIPLQLHPSELGIASSSKKEERRLITPSIEGSVREDEGVEYVDLKIEDREVSVPRETSSQDGIVGVSADPQTKKVDTLNIDFSPKIKYVFDRDLVWIHTGKQPFVSFTINPDHNLNLVDLIGNHLLAYNTAVGKLQEILDYQSNQ